VVKSAAIAVLLLVLTACGAPRPHPAVRQPATQPVASSLALPPAGIYPIDSGNSELRVLVYRAGAFARLGHNHVIVNRAVSGSVRLAATVTASSFSLTVPVTGFTVDEAQLRREEGSDFPGEIADDAKTGTLENMLSPALLNAAAFPIITVQSVALQGAQGAVTATLKISVAGHEAMAAAPFLLQYDAHRLTATGSLELRQTAMGLTPYSLMLGALQVQDAMQIKFKIVVPIS
jgi:hypothetical protein